MVKTIQPRTHKPFDRLFLALGLLAGIVVFGTVGFVLIEGHSLVDALYLTLITISTLGMQAATDADISTGGKLWIMLLIAVGIAGAMMALSVIVGMVVEGHVRSILGRRHVDKKIASLNDHVIVAGYGRMGQSLCASLQLRGKTLVVMDRDPEHTSQAETDGFLYVLGDATEEATLRAAGIERAKSLVTALATDADNVFATLVARELNRGLFIAARAERFESESRLLSAGANRTLCPQVIGATRLANILTRPGVVDVIDFASHGLDLEAEQYHIAEGSKLVGQSLRQANLPRLIGILVIAIKRKDREVLFNPDPDTVLAAEDELILTGQAGSMAKLKERFS